MLIIGLRTSCRHAVALVAISVLCAVSLRPEAGFAAAEVALSVDRHDITVGDPIQYTLTVRYDTTDNIIGPGIGSDIGSFVVLHDTTLAEGTVEAGRKVYKRRLRLTVFETGDLWIPPLTGELVDTLGHATTWSTDSMSIAVVSVLGGDDPDSADIRAIKSQYEVNENAWLYWTIGGALLLAAIIAWWLWRRRRHAAASTEAARQIPAWEAALASLDEMRRGIDPSSDGGRLWYFRLSEILRRYFDQRYGWTSIDETTSQLYRRLRSAPFDQSHRDRIHEFFREADRIRYARIAAKDGRPDVDWDWVREFVENTRHVPVLTPEDGNGQTAPGDSAGSSEVAEPSEEEVRS